MKRQMRGAGRGLRSCRRREAARDAARHPSSTPKQEPAMDSISCNPLSGLIALFVILGVTAPAMAEERTPTRQAIEALKGGGHIIYFRHFETGADAPDQHLAQLADCATQRQLNEQGLRQAARVRDAFQRLRIPVGEVLASPFCRAWQSADVSFGRHTKVDGLKLPPSRDYTDADKRTMREALPPLLTRAPAAGTNTIVMAHDDDMPAAGGPEIKTQGEAVIVKPDGRGASAWSL
jgi:hypothetical protein